MVFWDAKVHYSAGSFLFCWLSLGLVVWSSYNYHYLQLFEFFTPALTDDFSLEFGIKSPQVSRTLHSISADLNDAVVLDGFHRPSYFHVLQSLYQSFGDCTMSINYNCFNCHFHVPHFFRFPSKVVVLILLFAFFQLYSAVSWDSKVHNSAGSLFLVDYYLDWSSGRDKMICLYLKIPRKFMRLIFLDGFWIVNLLVWPNLNFLHNSRWVTLSTQSCLVLYYFYTSLLHSLIMWLIVSSLSPHNLHQPFCWVLSILALTWFVLMALFCAAIGKDSVYFIRFQFFSHVHVFLSEMLLFSRLKHPLNCYYYQYYYLSSMDPWASQPFTILSKKRRRRIIAQNLYTLYTQIEFCYVIHLIVPPNALTYSSGAVKYTDCSFAEDKKKKKNTKQKKQQKKTTKNQGESWYDTKESDFEVPVLLELLGNRSTSLFPLLLSPRWLGVVTPDQV